MSVDPQGRVRTSWTLKAHLDHHFYPGRVYADCDYCGVEEQARNGDTERAAFESAWSRHPVNLPMHVAARDQAQAARREDHRSSARGLVTALLLIAVVVTAIPGVALTWAWFTNLGPVLAVHLAGPALLFITALAVYGLTRIGKP